MGHITPEAQDGGPTALAQTGDKITIDAKKRTINMAVSEAGIGRRRALQSNARHAVQIHQERQVCL